MMTPSARKDSLKICLLCYRGNPHCGGQGIYIHYLSKELCNLGHEVHVISGPPYPEVVEGVTLHKLKSLNLYESKDSLLTSLSRIKNPVDFHEFVAVCLGTFPEPFTFSIRAYHKLKQLLPYHKFDIIHDNQGLGYGLLLMKRLGIPVIATIHHPIPIDRELILAQAKSFRQRFRLRRWYSFCTMQRIVSPHIERVITVSQSSAEAIEHFFKVPQDRLRVVYNGVDTDIFRRDDNMLKEPDSLILVNSGEQPIKGVPYLLRALQLLRRDMEMKLTIVGNHIPNGQHARLIKEYGLEDVVTFMGQVTTEELVKRYSASEVAVIPSLYEGFGFPAAEAMACELPIVATRGGALPEIVGQDGDAGILVPPADPGALAAAIMRLLSDESLRSKVGKAGRKRIETNFTWEQATKKVLEVYEDL